jgi:hypothetical protein
MSQLIKKLQREEQHSVNTHALASQPQFVEVNCCFISFSHVISLLYTIDIVLLYCSKFSFIDVYGIVHHFHYLGKRQTKASVCIQRFGGRQGCAQYPDPASSTIAWLCILSSDWIGNTSTILNY